MWECTVKKISSPWSLARVLFFFIIIGCAVIVAWISILKPWNDSDIASSISSNFTALGAVFSSLVFFVMYFQFKEAIKSSEEQALNSYFMTTISIVSSFRNEIMGYYPNSSCAVTRSVGLQNVFLRLMDCYKNNRNSIELNQCIKSVSEDTNIIPYFYALCDIVNNISEQKYKYAKNEDCLKKIISILNIEEKIILYFFMTIEENYKTEFIKLCNKSLGEHLNQTEIQKYLDYGWTTYAIKS